MRTEHIVIEDYTPQWKTEFQKIVASLGNEILAKSLSIEHVGSTSVENLAAKPIIDIDIVIPDMSVFPEMKSLLEKKGYRHEGNLGIEGREAFSYDICWENYSGSYQFTLRMDRKRSTFAIEYFNSEDRMRDYASFIVWLSLFFHQEQELILCDENNEDTLILSANTSVEDIEEWLGKLGI